MASLIAYNLILTSLLPVFMLWGIWRLLKGKSRTGWGQRLGFLKSLVAEAEEQARAAGNADLHPRIWVHACSVGEVNAVRPVVKQLRESLPDALIFLSTITPTGQSQAKRSCPEANAVFFFPLDLIPIMWAALHILKPEICILSEKELWPNFLALCQIRKIPVVEVNCIISDDTTFLSRCFKGFECWLMSMVTFFSVQTERDRARLMALGVGAGRIGIDGNTKFDQPVAESGKEQALAELLGWQESTAGIVAGSTHPGEEEIVLEAFLRLRRSHPQARLLIAPRHPERAPSVAAAIEKARLPWICRSELGKSNNGDSKKGTALSHQEEAVVILDTIGELSLAYRLSRAAFVGGSLFSHLKGHNPLEVMAEGRPAFYGPHTRDHRDITALLCQEKVGFVVKNAEELALGWQKAIENPPWRADIKQRAEAVMRRHQGSSGRAAQRVLAVISAKRAEHNEKRDAGAIPAPIDAAIQGYAVGDSLLDRSKAYLLEVINQGRSGLAPKVIRTGFEGLSYCYRAALAANLALYQARLLSQAQIPCPVISIGNITVGGTGKTLATLALCQWLISRKITPAVLSRGYGGEAPADRLVFDGEKLNLGPKEAGDEPFLLAASLPEARVLVGKDRRRSAELALRMGAEVMVLDDGFQYWKMQKDFDVVLIDALDPFGNGHLIPRGMLREPLSALQRAQAIWITHSDMIPKEDLSRLEDSLSEIAPGVPISYTIHQPVALRDFSSGDRIGLWTLERKRVLALSGIGNPHSFEYMLQKLGAEVIPARFPDHHYYREDEIAALLGTLPENINAIITTAKDAVRLPREIKAEAPIRILEIRLARLSGTLAKVDDIGELLEETFHWLPPIR